jgi:23S rRNA U2552 (ribose-2'-O)-methylase RlmE/FtsJ
MKKTLLDIHMGLSEKVSDKWESYFPVYERLFEPLRERDLNMLEIGVQNGGSLDTWSQYFANAKHIVGCDIDPKCDDLWYADARVNVVVGNACTPEVKSRVLAHAPEFDIVIDDGSHTTPDIIAAFLLYFPVVRPGGLFVVEDTHAIYRQGAGGVLSQKSAQAFFKSVAELTNLEHWQSELHPQTLMSTFFPSRQSFPAWLFEEQVSSVEFANSLIVIRKGHVPSRLGKRLVTGRDAVVATSPLRFRAPGDVPGS